MYIQTAALPEILHINGLQVQGFYPAVFCFQLYNCYECCRQSISLPFLTRILWQLLCVKELQIDH